MGHAVFVSRVDLAETVGSFILKLRLNFVGNLYLVQTLAAEAVGARPRTWKADLFWCRVWTGTSQFSAS
jgi:hypothetical protein